jgi:hypothetical protein
MELSPDRMVRLDLSSLTMNEGPVVRLPMDAVYELLEGKGADITTPDALVRLSPRDEDLVIDYTRHGAEESTQWRVSLSEVAMAWNMLAGTSSAG